MVIAFGIVFILAGFVTSWALTGIGVVIAVRGCRLVG
jgi:p-aminobenzoyl-glutamate transporter AbgT